MPDKERYSSSYSGQSLDVILYRETSMARICCAFYLPPLIPRVQGPATNIDITASPSIERFQLFLFQTGYKYLALAQSFFVSSHLSCGLQRSKKLHSQHSTSVAMLPDPLFAKGLVPQTTYHYQGWAQLINIRANVEQSAINKGHMTLFMDGCHTQ